MIYHSACPKVAPGGLSCRGDVQYERAGEWHWLHCLMCGWRLESLVQRPRPKVVRPRWADDDDGEQMRLMEAAG